jgi:beta-galactosidase GanA
MKFFYKDSNFLLNEKKVFLNSGEIHYFRIKRELWDKHLEAAKEAGPVKLSFLISNFLSLRSNPHPQQFNFSFNISISETIMPFPGN